MATTIDDGVDKTEHVDDHAGRTSLDVPARNREPTPKELRAVDQFLEKRDTRRVLRWHDFAAQTAFVMATGYLAWQFVSVETPTWLVSVVGVVWAALNGVAYVFWHRVVDQSAPTLRVGTRALSPGEETVVEVGSSTPLWWPVVRLRCIETMKLRRPLERSDRIRTRTLYTATIPTTRTGNRWTGTLRVPPNAHDIEDGRLPPDGWTRSVRWRLELVSGVWRRMDVIDLYVLPGPAVERVRSWQERLAAPVEQRTRGVCPVCDVTLNGDACPGCGAEVFTAAQMTSLLEPLGLDDATWRQLLGELARPSPWSCPACGKSLVRVALKGISIDVCPGCGTSVFERGEAVKITARIWGTGRVAAPSTTSD